MAQYAKLNTPVDQRSQPHFFRSYNSQSQPELIECFTETNSSWQSPRGNLGAFPAHRSQSTDSQKTAVSIRDMTHRMRKSTRNRETCFYFSVRALWPFAQPTSPIAYNTPSQQIGESPITNSARTAAKFSASTPSKSPETASRSARKYSMKSSPEHAPSHIRPRVLLPTEALQFIARQGTIMPSEMRSPRAQSLIHQELPNCPQRVTPLGKERFSE